MRAVGWAILLLELVGSAVSRSLVSRRLGSRADPHVLKSQCQSDPRRLWWFGKCWCEPGWLAKEGSGSEEVPDCSAPLLKNGDCDCFSDSPQNRTFLLDNAWMHDSGYRCTALCRYTPALGVPRSIPQEWMDNQIWKQLSFYKKELPQTRHNHLRGRLDEFANAYDGWKFLEGQNLGNVLELGAGGYTQIRNILERVNASMRRVTLVDPLLDHYKTVARCPYATGSLKINDTSYPTTLVNTSIEVFGEKMLVGQQLQGTYDTVILMNVLVYAQDALKILEIMYASLKMGGLLLFHDRFFEDSVRSSRCKTAGFIVNVLQVSKGLLDHFLDHFSHEPFFNANQTAEQLSRSVNWCLRQDNEVGYFVAVRKDKKVLL